MHNACASNATHTCFFGDKLLITHVSKTKKIEYFHPMNPNAKCMSPAAVDRNVWAVSTQDIWVLLKAGECIKGKSSFIAPNQVRAAGNKVEDTAMKFDGNQCIYLILKGADSQLFDQNAVLVIYLKKPTIKDMKKYVSVILTPTNGWKLYQEKDVKEIAFVKKEKGVNDNAER